MNRVIIKKKKILQEVDYDFQNVKGFLSNNLFTSNQEFSNTFRKALLDIRNSRPFHDQVKRETEGTSFLTTISQSGR